ncbi:carboxyl transferase domain-containing protein [Methylocystis parvus]|uniref:carboxyl transferase domain-containing protein n=1 Tax=Methylocystis parvus TaxID=134 RepID=UPI003C77EA3B
MSARLGGGNKRRPAPLTARERIELLRHGIRRRSLQVSSGDGVVTGWGTVNGRAVFVFAKDFTSSAARFRDACPEDHQAAGHGAQEPRADHRLFDAAARASRKASRRSAAMARSSSATCWPRASSRRSPSSWDPAPAATSIRRQ